ncbi:hypothetical protein [Streptomyces longispororuber]|nr:hypothetical protein [Streptomyces longispororuber]
MRRAFMSAFMTVATLTVGAAGSAHAVDVADASTLRDLPILAPDTLTEPVEGAAGTPSGLVTGTAGQKMRQMLPSTVRMV